MVTFSERHPVDRVGFWCPAPPGELEAMVAREPERFFRPPFGGRGRLGVQRAELDDDVAQRLVS
jgi:hypothetical protein